MDTVKRRESFSWLLFKSVSLLKACLKHKLPGSLPLGLGSLFLWALTPRGTSVWHSDRPETWNMCCADLQRDGGERDFTEGWMSTNFWCVCVCVDLEWKWSEPQTTSKRCFFRYLVLWSIKKPWPRAEAPTFPATFYSLSTCSSKCGPCIKSTSITWKCVRNIDLLNQNLHFSKKLLGASHAL